MQFLHLLRGNGTECDVLLTRWSDSMNQSTRGGEGLRESSVRAVTPGTVVKRPFRLRCTWTRKEPRGD